MRYTRFGTFLLPLKELLTWRRLGRPVSAHAANTNNRANYSKVLKELTVFTSRCREQLILPYEGSAE